ncbi:hypothetical protein ACYTPF_02015 [Alteromonas sp. HB246098]
MKQESMQKAFMYPPRSQNEFLDLNKKALHKLGYDVQPTDLTFIRYLLSRPKKAIVILNWVEDRVYGRSYKTTVQYFFKMVLLVIFSKICAKKVIWIKHNFRPHNSRGSTKRFDFLCKLYSLLNIPPISLESYFSSPSLIHPLYKSNNELIEDEEETEQENTIDVLFFGGIKPYKNLDKVLLDWPSSLSLKIAGKCSDLSYTRKLEKIIKERGLNVDWDNRFLSSDELNEMLKASKFVLLPHSDNTMISSGSFYHAIGEGCNVLVNSSQFGRVKSEQHSFVHLVDIGKISKDLLQTIFVSKREVRKEVLACYGENRVVEAWNTVINNA